MDRDPDKQDTTAALPIGSATGAQPPVQNTEESTNVDPESVPLPESDNEGLESGGEEDEKMDEGASISSSAPAANYPDGYAAAPVLPPAGPHGPNQQQQHDRTRPSSLTGNWDYLQDTLAIIHLPGECPDETCDHFRDHSLAAHASRVPEYVAAENARGLYIEEHANRILGERYTAILREEVARESERLRGERDVLQQACMDAEKRAQEAERVAQEAATNAEQRAAAAEAKAKASVDAAEADKLRDVSIYSTKAHHRGEEMKKMQVKLDIAEKARKGSDEGREAAEKQISSLRRELQTTQELNDKNSVAMGVMQRRLAALESECKELRADAARLREQNEALQERNDDLRSQLGPYYQSEFEEDSVSDSSSVKERAAANKRVKESFKAGERLRKEREAMIVDTEDNLSLTAKKTMPKPPLQKAKGNLSPEPGDKRKRPDTPPVSGEPESSNDNPWIVAGTNWKMRKLETALDAWSFMEGVRRFDSSSARQCLDDVLNNHGRVGSRLNRATEFILQHWPTARDRGLYQPRPVPGANPGSEPPRGGKKVKTGSSNQGQSSLARPPPPHGEGPRYHAPHLMPPPYRGPRGPSSNEFRPQGHGHRGRTFEGYEVGPSFHNETFGPQLSRLPQGNYGMYSSGFSGPRRGPPAQYNSPPGLPSHRPRAPTKGTSQSNSAKKPPLDAPPEEWVHFWAETNQSLPQGIGRDDDGNPDLNDIAMHLLVRRIGFQQTDFPSGDQGREEWRTAAGRFTEMAMNIGSVPGLMKMIWEQNLWRDGMFQGNLTRPFPRNREVTQEAVARQLRIALRGESSMQRFETWARHRRNVLLNRDVDDASDWPSSSSFTLATVRALRSEVLGRSRLDNRSPGGHFGSAPLLEEGSRPSSTSGPQSHPEDPTSPEKDDDQMQEDQ